MGLSVVNALSEVNFVIFIDFMVIFAFVNKQVEFFIIHRAFSRQNFNAET